MTRSWNRWIPAIAAPVVVGVVVAGGVFAASASADPADKTPQQVLELAASSTLDTFSGTIEQSSKLGLPDLSGVTGSSGADAGDSELSSALELLTGSHTARVYVDGESKSRFQILDDMAERDVIRNGSDIWFYDSSDSTAVHSTLPTPASDSATPGAEALTPTEVATRFLDSVDPSTDVTVGDPVRVAGRSAYSLVLTPDSSTTLVGSVDIAVDADTGAPLSVDVYARGSDDAAFHVAYTAFSLDTPSADLFAFTPPSGTDVTEKSIPDKGSAAPAPDATAHPEPSVTGTGWDSIVELPAGDDASALTESPMLDQLTTPVDGGHVLQTTLLTVLITDDGRVLAGAVPVDSLQAAAATATP